MNRRLPVVVTWLLLLGLAALAARVAPAAPADETTEPPQVRLSWKARNETTIFGYIVYRSNREEGPFRRVSPQIHRVPLRPDADHDGSYEFIDRDVRRGETYFYHVGIVGVDGHKRPFSKIISKTVDP